MIKTKYKYKGKILIVKIDSAHRGGMAFVFLVTFREFSVILLYPMSNLKRTGEMGDEFNK